MTAVLRPALVLLAVMTAITGILYPLAVTGAAAVLFPAQAQGSTVRDAGGTVIGSGLIGQPFDDPRYFWGRPSATAPFPCNAASSTGSNLGPSNPALHDAVRTRVEALRAADPGNAAPVPVDLVTTSGSGLDPHISPAAALYQAGRIARHRGLASADVEVLVEQHTERRFAGLLGEPVVNVLQLNLALDGLGRSSSPR